MHAINSSREKKLCIMAVLGACLNTVGEQILCEAMSIGSLF